MAVAGKKAKRRKYRKGLRADYRGATPEQVAQALHRYRPSTCPPTQVATPELKSSL